jgi:hypothetical protein
MATRRVDDDLDGLDRDPSHGTSEAVGHEWFGTTHHTCQVGLAVGCWMLDDGGWSLVGIS